MILEALQVYVEERAIQDPTAHSWQQQWRRLEMKQLTVTCKVGQAARLLGEVNIQDYAVQQKWQLLKKF